ncbi:MAG: hypothetical protein ACRDSP_09610 [Pseudonocardiaceae bacterium]
MSHDGVEDSAAGAEVQGEPELPELRQRMSVIREEVAAEVEAKWATPYRTPAVFDLKVKARLASHQEYRSLQDRVRSTEAAQAADSGS